MATCDADMKKLAEAFYNDTYLFDQNACSAPHTIFGCKMSTWKRPRIAFGMLFMSMLSINIDYKLW